jgi:hypothetical protein
LTRVVLGQNILKWSVYFQTRNNQGGASKT